MTTRRVRFLLGGLLLLPAVAWSMGGWAVISVDDLPDYAVAGHPVTISFVVRQHGVTPLGGLSPRVVAKSAGAEREVAATPTAEKGHYSAAILLPSAGDWTVTVISGFVNARTTLVPIRAVAAGDRPAAALSEGERGRRLFVAKGCVTCHTHAATNATSELSFGPDLTERRYPADYLARFLADPSIRPSSRADGTRMPNLALKPAEIASLVAFVNGERRVSGR